MEQMYVFILPSSKMRSPYVWHTSGNKKKVEVLRKKGSDPENGTT